MSYQQKYQRLPKRQELSTKTLKRNTPGGPTDTAKFPLSQPMTRPTVSSDYNTNENIEYEMGDYSGMGGGTNFTAPPETYTMNVGLPVEGPNVFMEGAGEFVQVVARIRPMLQFELARGDDYCIKVIDQQTLQLNKGAGVKSFRFNRVIDESASQSDVFHQSNCAKIINSALEGYSTTLFAYGQTGSGKTYTIAGNEEKLSKDVYVSDDTEGIIPRSVRYLWQQMAQRQENFYIKASFMEIYNEQLNDLLDPSSEGLQYRWNIQNGFFVEDLMVVDCANVNDMIAVLNQGMKHRRVGSHELNKDSSRSHSILTIYLVIELNNNGQVIRKMGKISFVDLAGSERLKESKSSGTMVKETQQINKSLFTLGKVISTLSDKKNKNPYIPYRDSKLTMLLMDSLGGKSKALMISCVSPSEVYYEETLNTLNYATRTMNVKNKPTIQMDDRSQAIYNLTKENELLKMENKFLREQLQRAANGLPLEIPGDFKGVLGDLGPLVSNRRQASAGRRPGSGVEIPYNKVG